MAERWVPVKGYEGAYEVSDLGRVRSVHRVVVRSDGRNRTIYPRVLQPRICCKNGYLYVNLCINGKPKNFTIHKVMSLSFSELGGQMPDHKNRDKTDNRLTNLRPATKSQNGMNTNLSKRNTSGHRGVHKHPYGWVASIRSDGKSRHLGLFKSKKEAALVRKRAEKLYFGEFSASYQE